MLVGGEGGLYAFSLTHRCPLSRLGSPGVGGIDGEQHLEIRSTHSRWARREQAFFWVPIFVFRSNQIIKESGIHLIQSTCLAGQQVVPPVINQTRRIPKHEEAEAPGTRGLGGGGLGIHTYYGGTLRYTLPRVCLDACAMRCVVMSTDERAGTIDSTARKDCRFISECQISRNNLLCSLFSLFFVPTPPQKRQKISEYNGSRSVVSTSPCRAFFDQSEISRVIVPFFLFYRFSYATLSPGRAPYFLSSPGSRGWGDREDAVSAAAGVENRKQNQLWGTRGGGVCTNTSYTQVLTSRH